MSVPVPSLSCIIYSKKGRNELYYSDNFDSIVNGLFRKCVLWNSYDNWNWIMYLLMCIYLSSWKDFSYIISDVCLNVWQSRRRPSHMYITRKGPLWTEFIPKAYAILQVGQNWIWNSSYIPYRSLYRLWT